MSDVLKVVFVCEALAERQVWYVSDRYQAKRMVRHYITSPSGKVLAKYKHNAYQVEIREMFKTTHEVYYDVVTSWGRD